MVCGVEGMGCDEADPDAREPERAEAIHVLDLTKQPARVTAKHSCQIEGASVERLAVRVLLFIFS